jgi:hypothetical protein
MKPKGYLVFHLNLAFSSIEEETRADVIRVCYHSLLDLIEQTGIPVGVELTGWTLGQIHQIDDSWVTRFKKLLHSGSCELIGSGYSQIIAPLAPNDVNIWNQKLGIDSYKAILDYKPKVVLVNEMAFSSSLVDLYSKFDYDGLIMDRDNVKLAIEADSLSLNNIPTHAEGSNGLSMPVLWSDSILFQKLQHFAHGDIPLQNYINYVKERIKDGETVLPIYCNDAEIFDFRPGRFAEERPTHSDGEWNRIKRLLESLKSETNINFVSPSEALDSVNEEKVISKLVSTAYPVPVKKQSKYNIGRWAVSGREDTWINTLCHRITKHLIESKNDNPDDWRELCELWTSDLRTHITEKRWDKTKKNLIKTLRKHSINSKFTEYDASQKFDPLNNVIGIYGDALIELNNDNIYLSVLTKKIKLELNLRRGLAIESLSFVSHEMKPCIGTLPHGYFQNISLGADYYSGNTVLELPLLRKKITDLELVHPKFLLRENGDIEIHAEIKTHFGTIIKVFEISLNKELVSLRYYFTNCDKIIGSLRLGAITLINQFSDSNTILSCCNGGDTFESFSFDGEFNHSSPATNFVSSSSGLGATSGKIQIDNQGKSIKLEWDPSYCAAMPMLQNSKFKGKTLSRLFFSLHEFDDTVKEAVQIKPFIFSISA